MLHSMTTKPAAAQPLTISDLAQRTGVSAATLRAWETRHGFPTPTRRESGHRRYDERDPYDDARPYDEPERSAEPGRRPGFDLRPLAARSHSAHSLHWSAMLRRAIDAGQDRAAIEAIVMDTYAWFRGLVKELLPKG